MRSSERAQLEALNFFQLMLPAVMIARMVANPYHTAAQIEAVQEAVEREVRGVAHRRLAIGMRRVFERMAEGE